AAQMMQYGVNAPESTIYAATKSALTAALAKAWRPIESAPHGERVLLGWTDWRDGQWCMDVGCASHGMRHDNGYSSVSHHGSATVWMPLPAAPGSEGG